MSDIYSEELYTKKNVCLVCNHIFVDAEEPWYIFHQRISAEAQTEFSISELLCKVLEKDINENTVHSTFLCEICHANLLEFESLERRLAELRQRIKEKYEATLNLYEKRIAPIKEETLLENNNKVDIEDNVFIVPDSFAAKEELLSEEALLSYKIDEFGAYHCLCCNAASFPNVQLLVNHMKIAHKKLLHVCILCEEIFEAAVELNLHLESAHVNNNEFAGYECEACNLNFTDFQEFRQHRRTTHDERAYKCQKCGKGFATKFTLHSHAKIHTERERPYQCDKCKKSFLNEKNLKNHLKSHFDKKPYICISCGKTFKSQYNLDVHNIVHTKVRPYACRVCGKTFARRSEIKDHERIHTGERPFKCDLCPLAFTQRANLCSHKKSTHLNEKLHKCEQCDRAFKRRRLLDYHIQAVHTGERPLKCEVCGMGFVYPEHFKKHLLIHTGLKPYACEVCGKKFKSRDNRNAHRFVHSDKKPYECLQCGAGFMRKPQLLQHMNNTAHATDTIIINQPQINSTLIKSKVEEVNDELQSVLANTQEPEADDAVMTDNFVNENLEEVKYLQFEDFDNNDQGSIAWMNIEVKPK